MSAELRLRHARTWLLDATQDLRTAANMGGAPHLFEPRHAGFFAQQAAEKAIKAALVFAGKESPGDIHNRQGALPEDQVLRWGIELCDVLHFLHSQREPIVYRDLKPSNVLEHAQTGRLVLVDFGVARRATPGQIGTAVGTPGYAAPEQY